MYNYLKLLSFKHNCHKKKKKYDFVNFFAENLLKACVSYFLSNFYFSPNNSPSKTMKNVFYFI